MVARSVITLGVSTERGAVHAVALADCGTLSERVLLHRSQHTHGDTKADVAAAVATVLDELAADLGPDREIGGAAVAYRDAAERRTIVSALAAGPWHTASMVSAKSAHLSVASLMTWLDEFDNLLVGEVVPGYQAFTLVDRGRRRVLAAVGQAGRATSESLGMAVTAAWDQLEAAATRPDAVVLIGSAGAESSVLAAVQSFGAPVIPCRMAAFASAVGAASSARVAVDGFDEPVEEVVPRVRGGAAMFAAASVLAGGLLVGGVYAMNGFVRPTSTAVAADARVTADGRVVAGSAGAGDRGTAPGEHGSGRPAQTGGSFAEPTAGIGGLAARLPLSAQPRGAPVPLVSAEVGYEVGTNATASLVPGSGIPTTTEVGTPNGALLFPGEVPPPSMFSPEAADWWDKHFRMMTQWGTRQVLPT
ncbi:hypothetical protein OH799_30940 [Nocardia sp. NBC_00881]|uniref:hypothetical protein n=1 Tax=Nocardia sp. NBC_00881 TaxID=2975995 RepID=UPI0038670C5F|nr:hypothetical protein OH799_30940 [Nocardia sp. NBC_00881]